MQNKKIILALCAISFISLAAAIFYATYTKNDTKNDSTPYEQQIIKNNPEHENIELQQDKNENPDEKKSSLSKNKPIKNSTIKISPILKIRDSDYYVGDKNAPILVIEYASLSCPHCASFSNAGFDKLKSEYIENGKVVFVFRSFPLNQSSLSASMLTHCQAQNNPENANEKYYLTLKILFKTQDNWAFGEKFEEKLFSIARLDGMSMEAFKSCLSNQKLQDRILNDRIEASKELEIKSTPSFFVNGELSEGYIDYPTLKSLIDKKLSEKGK